MSLAPVAYLLFQKWMRHDPTDPQWLGRDRFVLSNGHSSLTLYIQLFLSGYGLELEDLESFRTWGSKTPGHPEFGHTAGVETTTGPLGSGVATAVGMAMDARYVRGLLDADAPKGTSPFDHRVWVIAGDGCLQEGVSAEASSLAGHQALGNLVMIYDDNHISIEGDTAVSFSEDVIGRYVAYGWNVDHVDMAADGSVDVAGLNGALERVTQVTDRPSIIRVRNIIGWPAPNLQNTGKVHGSALGEAEVTATKEILGVDTISRQMHGGLHTQIRLLFLSAWLPANFLKLGLQAFPHSRQAHRLQLVLLQARSSMRSLQCSLSSGVVRQTSARVT